MGWVPVLETFLTDMDTLDPHSPASGSCWFYADSDNKPAGPVTSDQLRELLGNGTITGNTHVCEPGVDNWRRLSEIPSLASSVSSATSSSPPPLPAPSVGSGAPSGPWFPAYPRLENFRVSLCEAWAVATKHWRKIAEVNPPPATRPWYHRTATIVASSAMCFPASLALIWTTKRFKLPVQIGMSFVCLFIIPFFTLAFLRAGGSSSTSRPPRIASTYDEKATPIYWSEIDYIYGLHAETTDLMKDEKWKQYRNKRVRWSGEVAEVTKGVLGGLTVHVKMNDDTFTSDVLLELRDGEEAKAMKLSKGQGVSFEGRLKQWGTILPITADDGILR